MKRLSDDCDVRETAVELPQCANMNIGKKKLYPVVDTANIH